MVEPGVLGSFVARIWLEGEAGNDPTWRGRIQHVQGEEECIFENLMQLREFLERVCGIPLPIGNESELDGSGTRK